MPAHFGILPTDVLDALSTRLNERFPHHDGHESGLGTRFLRLPHPRSSIPSLFLPYILPPIDLRSDPAIKTSILEVQAVAPTNSRSWFLEDEVITDGKLLVMTPMDPVFLLLPLLKAVLPSDGSPGAFRPIDDIFEDISSKLPISIKAVPDIHDTSSITAPQDLVFFTSLDCVRSAMDRVCEVKEITPDLLVYRFSHPKLVDYLRAKVARLATPHVFEDSRTLTRALAKDGLMEDGKEVLLESGRLRSACELVSQYVPEDVYVDLLSSYDFTQLESHLYGLQDELMAIDAAKHADTKKTKTEDPKKRKAAKASQGVEKLKKANINGMAKLSTFFKTPSK